MIDNGPYSGQGNNGRTIHPLGVDVHRQRHKRGLSSSVIAIIALSAFTAVVLCSAVVWVFLFRKRDCIGQPARTQEALVPSLARPPGKIITTVIILGVIWSIYLFSQDLRKWID